MYSGKGEGNPPSHAACSTTYSLLYHNQRLYRPRVLISDHANLIIHHVMSDLNWSSNSNTKWSITDRTQMTNIFWTKQYPSQPGYHSNRCTNWWTTIFNCKSTLKATSHLYSIYISFITLLSTTLIFHCSRVLANTSFYHDVSLGYYRSCYCTIFHVYRASP